MMSEQFQYLAIKNWEKYQSDEKGRIRSGPSLWVKDWTDKESDRGYMTLTVFQRYILDGCQRLRGRTGRNLPNDAMYIARALNVLGTERARVVNALATLVERGFLLLTNQQDDFPEKIREEKRREDKTADTPNSPLQNLGQTRNTSTPRRPAPRHDPAPASPTPLTPNATPHELTHGDLAPTLLQQMGVGLSATTVNAAMEALRVKTSQPGAWDTQKACLHIIDRWSGYKASPVFRTQYRKSPARWLIDGCYDDPEESWQSDSKSKRDHDQAPSASATEDATNMIADRLRRIAENRQRVDTN